MTTFMEMTMIMKIIMANMTKILAIMSVIVISMIMMSVPTSVIITIFLQKRLKMYFRQEKYLPVAQVIVIFSETIVR